MFDQNNEGKTIAVIYLRAVNQKEEDQINSLAAQEHVCRQYAESNGYDVIKVFKEASGGQKTLERSGIMKLLNFCAHTENGVGAVIVANLDRLSRRYDDYNWLRVLLKQCGADIAIATKGELPPAVQRFLDSMRAFVDQYLAEKTSYREGGEECSEQEDA